jgi:hypothetical protein
MTTTRTIKTALAELQAHGYDARLSRDGWLIVYGPYGPDTYLWGAWFSPNNGNDVTWGEVPQEVFDLAYFEARTALDALMQHGRWSHNGALALSNYLKIHKNHLEGEVNVNFLADNWIEYSSALEAAKEHGYAAPDEEEALAWLRARTVAIPFDGGVIVVQF